MLSFKIGTNVVDASNVYEVKKILLNNIKIVDKQLKDQNVLRNVTKAAILFKRNDSDNTCYMLTKTFEETLEKILSLRDELRVMHRHLDNISRLEINLHIVRVGIEAVELGRIAEPASDFNISDLNKTFWGTF
ncbi:hypothetical protein B9Z55_017605 [Caenorhabditis nigoni]|uniref:Uncharacterized protein n=1 Tax=Caenorhabditis nigoni TaxID=1611254 RepID=A0A2G5TAB0_9PELO|nr:hypothetical protein B9Z55_017605 [Caenorhabditis nigoni]